MLLKELLGLANLTKAQLFCIYELTNIIIVYKYQNLIFTACQLMMLGFKSFNKYFYFLKFDFLLEKLDIVPLSSYFARNKKLFKNSILL